MIGCMRNTCTRSGCENTAFGRGLCSPHYQHASYHGQLPDRPQPRPCAHCGKTFTSRKWNAQYCSKSCNDAARHARRHAACLRRASACNQCGASLADKRPNARFCSNECGQNWRNARTATRLRERRAISGKLCVGCCAQIPIERRGNALYCSTECKTRSRRHEAYGLTKEELEVLLVQHEQCAICRTGEWGKKGPQVDHCHATGVVRGVLCGNCNQGLGRFGDDPARLRAAAEYLERHRTVT